MGIYIKDYDIPSGECEHMVFDFTTMKATAIFGNRKQYDIISVKAPHGRLIDGDKFYEEFEPNSWPEGMAVSTFIKKAPTVIESEDE